MISGNEPEFARAVALLLHEAALIDRYWITSSKHAARMIYILRRCPFGMIDGWELSMLSIKSQSLLQFDPAVALTGVSFGR